MALSFAAFSASADVYADESFIPMASAKLTIEAQVCSVGLESLEPRACLLRAFEKLAPALYLFRRLRPAGA